MESLPLSCRRTPVMSPIDAKFDINKVIMQEKTEVKDISRRLKFTPLKEGSVKAIHRYNSADKLKAKRNIFERKIISNIENNPEEEMKNSIDYEIAKVSQSAEKVPRKFKSKIKKDSK